MRYKVQYSVYYVDNGYRPDKTLIVSASSPEEAREQVREFELVRADGVPIRTFSVEKVAEQPPSKQSRFGKWAGTL